MEVDPGKKVKILLVEDEPTVARVCARILAIDGFQVDIAADGEAAREMMKFSSYDMCLADIRMPGESGIDFYRYLEYTDPALAEKVAFTTGDILGMTTGNFLKEANRPFLAKPFTPAELKRVVHGTLDQLPVSTF